MGNMKKSKSRFMHEVVWISIAEEIPAIGYMIIIELTKNSVPVGRPMIIKMCQRWLASGQYPVFLN